MDIKRILRAIGIFLLFIAIGIVTAGFIIFLNQYIQVKYIFVGILLAICFCCCYILAER